MDSPLLFPVKLTDDGIVVLDETVLPFAQEYISVKSLEDAVWVLREMKTRSLGQVLLFFYCCVEFHQQNSFEQIAGLFKQQRPTFDFEMLAQILRYQTGPSISVRDVVRGFIRGFDASRRKRAAYLAQLLPEVANILTICNVNGELIYLYEELKKLNKQASFYVCETRPYLQGTRQTFWELNINKIPVKLLCDNQAAVLMKAKTVNCVITGADRATIKGDVINKIGTYALARLAKHFNIPFYPLTQYPRDINIDSIAIEERPPEEAFMFLSGSFSQFEAFYPAFDVTKHNFVTQSIVMEMCGGQPHRKV
jgi:methylthioribose-1-phosphate isomerase